MSARIWVACSLTAALVAPCLLSSPTTGCCPAPPSGKPVVNADQTVIIIWDAASKTQHFIRQASFKSDANDFGFLIPTPSPPELEESGNDAFPFLHKLTEPAKKKSPRPSGGMGCGCSASPPPVTASAVHVLSEKLVAGFDAVVLEADSADALVEWLRNHGYDYSPEIEAWARPYVQAGWKITALKVAKGKDGNEQRVATSALRMTFKSDRPLFPYREPDSSGPTRALGTHKRLLRIFFFAEARYRGDLTEDVTWTGTVAWANKLNADDCKKALDLLKLPETTGPAEYWLTEFEDAWPYKVAPADLYFSRDANQNKVKREPIIEYASSTWPTVELAYAIAAAVVLTPWLRRFHRRARAAPPSRSVIQRTR